MIKKSLIAIASLITNIVIAGDINVDFSAWLLGETLMTNEIVDKMWIQFSKAEGLTSPNNNLTENLRKDNFVRNIQKIIEHNSQADKNYTRGISPYSDLSNEQFKRHFKIGAPQDCSATNKKKSLKKIELEGLPKSWDWRDYNGVSPVKDQGECGSCWTFSTVGALEARSLIKYGSFVPLSEQQLVDCAQAFNNFGCYGGLPSQAFEYLIYTGGISTEKSYPYLERDRNCTVHRDTFELAILGGSINITEGDEVELQAAVYRNGPVSVCFQVVDDFDDYKSGVYTSRTCKNSNKDVNHAVLAVGYGTENGLDYWLIKNSWGTGWGDHGYFKIQRGVNMCGIAMCNSFPKDVIKIGSSTHSGY